MIGCLAAPDSSGCCQDGAAGADHDDDEKNFDDRVTLLRYTHPDSLVGGTGGDSRFPAPLDQADEGLKLISGVIHVCCPVAARSLVRPRAEPAYLVRLPEEKEQQYLCSDVIERRHALETTHLRRLQHRPEQRRRRRRPDSPTGFWAITRTSGGCRGPRVSGGANPLGCPSASWPVAADTGPAQMGCHQGQCGCDQDGDEKVDSQHGSWRLRVSHQPWRRRCLSLSPEAAWAYHRRIGSRGRGP